ncbi:hypothetical protein [Delftia tsuruhatensis]|uniref:hypothetical protein n=1 Tax=Delftia tsuruhatensis TaxID=180282 RepID=UPI002AD51313|nr:hypothetical protein [Delftia tsuruhatensis]WQM80319.1 hypothetical protein RNT40_16490 [Delftia tsuruhatensis]
MSMAWIRKTYGVPAKRGGGAYSPRGGNKINKRRTHKAERRQGAAEAAEKGPAS